MNWYNFSKFKFIKKDSGRKREIKYISRLQFVGRLLGPTDLLSFNDKIKLFHLN